MTPVPMTGRDRTLTGLKRSPTDRFFPMADPFFPMTEQFSPAYSHTLSFRVHPRHVYVHVPFCARRCVYCDFAIAVRRHVPVDDYVSAIERELSIRFPEEGDWQVETLYFGGGTPSRLGGDGVSRLLDVLQERLTIAPHAEVTLEANPEDASLDAVRAWRAAGINRLSLGGQSFDDAVLRWMHRTHDARAIGRAVDNARRAGIDDLSLDLIFALPDEVERDWEADVDAALALAPTHLSLYGLTTEPATPLGRWRDRGVVTEAREENYEREFLHADRALTGAGFEHYEVSNFALPGHRAKHNSMYWRGSPYAGLGPGAHEFDGATRRWNVDAYVEWARRLAALGDPIEGSELLDDASREAERIYLGLRTSDGLRLSGAELVRTQAWIEAGWGTISETDLLTLTPLGWLRLDGLAADLTVVRSRS
jgi:putative oxygen-independent coproporphyrinogen III oxidase